MSSIIVAGDTSGSVTLQAPAVAGSTVLTLPAVSGTVLTSASSQVTGPAFSAYQSSAQTLSSNTGTKIQFQTEEFDTNSNFDNTTNYRFTPTVNGYYQVNSVINWATTSTRGFLNIYKNGSAFKQGMNISLCDGAALSALVYLNGSTDYIEMYGQLTVGQALNATSQYTYFQAVMVRSA